MIKEFCDRCEREIKGGAKRAKVKIETELVSIHEGVYCSVCYGDLREFLRGENREIIPETTPASS